jgi:hypothetical protein
MSGILLLLAAGLVIIFLVCMFFGRNVNHFTGAAPLEYNEGSAKGVSVGLITRQHIIASFVRVGSMITIQLPPFGAQSMPNSSGFKIDLSNVSAEFFPITQASGTVAAYIGGVLTNFLVTISKSGTSMVLEFSPNGSEIPVNQQVSFVNSTITYLVV